MGDGGIGLGAALAMYADEHADFTPTYLDDVYLGPKYGDEAIERAIDRVEIPDEYVIKQFDDESAAAETVADLLVDGHVVSLYTGQVEYGPRALGNRSILYQPTDPSAIEWLNQRLDRTEFMPFAPVTLKERADECYLDYDPDRCPAADFMTVSFDCTETMQDRSPGVVHVDGTARPQLIDEATNPLYYEILAAYEERTGIPSLINTSFNMHGEPIVCKPTEAIHSFLSTENDGLLMDQTLLRKGDQ
jgi:carbamoyltransferase